MIRGILALAVLAVLSLPCSASIRVGEAAPDLGLDVLLQAPEGASADWESLRGKVVVLEYWATWCRPCRKHIPHLNELAREFADDVVFISVTDEPRGVVEAFLEKNTIGGWVALDPDRSAFPPFDVGGVPDTIVIDREGRLAIDTQPEKLTASLLTRIVAGQPVTLTPPAMRELTSWPRDDGHYLYRVEIRLGGKPQAGRRLTHLREGSFEANASPLIFILAAAWDVSSDLIEGSVRLPLEYYDVRVDTGGRSPYGWREPLQQALQETFDLNVWTETRPVEVVVLSLIEGRPHAMEPVSAMVPTPWLLMPRPLSMLYGPGHIDFGIGGAGSAAGLLESTLSQPVFDETGLGHNWAGELSWDPADPESLVTAARDQLGLDLRYETRDLEVLRFEPRDDPAPEP